jgi:hypothetical protein
MDELRRICDKILEQNSGCREAMLSLIGSHETVAFVGAGLSTSPSLNYPSWKELLETLRVAANAIGPFSFSAEVNGKPLRMAEEIRSHFASKDRIDEFKNILSRQYGPRAKLHCTPTHDLLVKLPFKAFVTTNYDDCLEAALNDWHVFRGQRTPTGITTYIKLNGDARHMVSRFLRSLSAEFDMSQRHVAHLHGWHDDPESIILAASQYYNAYGFETKDGQMTKQEPRSTIHRQLVWSLLATRKLAFFGCSMDDPYIMELLRIVASDLWEAGQSIHFVVLPLDQKSAASANTQVEEFRRFGLQVVFYDNWDGTFGKLDQLLELASAKYSPIKTAQSESSLHKPAAKSQHPDELATGEARTGYAPTIAEVSLAWLEEVNETTSKDLKKNED